MTTLVALDGPAADRRDSTSPKRLRRIVLASNRGPLEYNFDNAGQLEASCGNGGVATALTSIMPLGDFVWIAGAMTEGDRLMADAGRLRVEVGDDYCYQRFVALPQQTYHRYYSVFSNPVLWFLQHSLWGELKGRDQEQIRKGWEEGYVPANRAFARAIVDEVNGDAASSYVMIQDYHLYLCPGYVRRLAPDVILQHFLHIPWPAPEVWQNLPEDIVQAICSSLLCADLVGFQTESSARNFALTCRSFLPDTTVDSAGHVIAREGRLTRIRSYPISVDVERLRSQTLSLDFARYRKRFQGMAGKHTIVRVDRLDPSKNILGGLDAFELLLLRHPELLGEVKLLSFLVPSRGSVPEFRQHAAAVRRRISEINGRYQVAGWRPIEAFEENNYTQALAGMSLYDVLLVNSLADGMNLVSKEGPIVNERNGTVVLSSEVGSHAELQEGVISVEPTDIEGTAEALWLGLTMPDEEKQRRADLLRRVITTNDLGLWLQRQSQDLSELAGEDGITFADASAIAG